MWFPTLATHYKLVASGVIENYTIVVDFKVNVQPATPEITVMTGGIYGQTFTAYTTYSGLQIMDRITTNSGTSPQDYKVEGILNNMVGPMPHFEVTLSRPN